MKSLFSSHVSKFNVLMALFTLSATTFSFPVTAGPQKVCVTTSGGNVTCGTPVQNDRKVATNLSS